MVRIGELGKRFHLSRSALLYYDSIGLLKPSGRTDSRYRLYSEDDAKRLERICLYRDMGIALRDIRELLCEQCGNTDILEYALINMETQVEDIRRKQQKIIQAIRKNKDIPASHAELFSSVLRNLGFTEADMRNFHTEYEKSDQAGHAAFLRFMGLTEAVIEQVRNYSK